MQPMDEIYQRYAMTVYKFLLSKTGSEDLSEELTQETFIRRSEASGGMMKASVRCRLGFVQSPKISFRCIIASD